MNKKNFILGILFSLILCNFCVEIDAQEKKKYPDPAPMTAAMTEIWTPQPKIVTPGEPVSAPSDAIVLFDGKDLSAWENDKGEPAPWKVENGVFIAGQGNIRTKQKFENFQLHVEWRIPEDVTGQGQGRGNSGVYLQGRYELQILDSYENETYINGMAASIYKQTPPLVNAMRKPGEWNVYDVIYSAPVFKDDGTYRTPPRVTLLHNGVVVQNNTTILGTTEYIGHPRVAKHGAGPILLQDHPGHVAFRNIWIREL
ncbi:MAG: DUF1080 domain-containing protein [Prevotellaceae bacterium]|jgi:hypothetical protein|nr:DUF1080 domain-containing protein [Prevotellaceae bacterium]